MSAYPTFTCTCGRVFYQKMDYKLHRNPYAAKVECPEVKPLKDEPRRFIFENMTLKLVEGSSEPRKVPYVSPYAPQPKMMFCDPNQGYKVVVTSDEVNSYKIEQKWLKEKARVGKILNNYS
jgi:hypothetical protein